MSASELHPLSALRRGARGRIARVTREISRRAPSGSPRWVSAGATVTVLQTFPGIVFECDQTELTVERLVARSILVELE
jgi:hypothetical protein